MKKLKSLKNLKKKKRNAVNLDFQKLCAREAETDYFFFFGLIQFLFVTHLYHIVTVMELSLYWLSENISVQNTFWSELH